MEDESSSSRSPSFRQWHETGAQETSNPHVDDEEEAGITSQQQFLEVVIDGQNESWTSSSQQSSKVRNGSAGRVMPLSFSPDRPYQSNEFEAATKVVEGLRFIDRRTENADQEAVAQQVQQRFNALACPNDGKLPRCQFAACIGMEGSVEFAEELLGALMRRRGRAAGSESITEEELREYWMHLTDKRFSSRMQIFFDLFLENPRCDKDLDGKISEEELKEAILLSASANRLSILSEQAEEYAALMMEELDRENKGEIGLSQLEGLLCKSALCCSEAEACLPPVPRIAAVGLHSFACNTKNVFLDDWRRLWIIGFWFTLMASLFMWKSMQYSYRSGFEVMGYCLSTAKGAAETLKLNMALILLPVCRNTITWLRSTRLGRIVPFDDTISFHKAIAGAIGLGVVIHGGAHLGCDFPRIAAADRGTFMRALGRDFHGCQPSFGRMVTSIEGVTGIAMVILMSVAFLLATNSLRRNIVKLQWPFHRLTGFNAFWYSHHLFVVVYALLMVHSTFLFLTHKWVEKTTWIYILIPTLLYLGERILRVFRACIYKVGISKAAIYTGNVLALDMLKPPGFRYQSGMYLFIQCPSISPFEWHPFSITSAPDDDNLSVHIRSLGDWTEEMMRLFSKAIEDSAKKSSEENGCVLVDGTFPKLYIDGPYGAAAQDYRRYDVMLLVGLGIGATPFVSILRDMLNHMKLAEQQQSPLHPQTPGLDRSGTRKARKPSNAYFYWVTREQGSFEWFKGVMNAVAEMDQKAVIEMHNYLTSVHEEGDARSAFITLIQALHHAKSGVDIVSGTRVRTHFARPNWNKVFARLAANHPNARIGVFYCGLSSAAKELDALAWSYSQKTNTKFEFRKESF